MEYRAIYKCRLCGKRYQTAYTGKNDLAFGSVVELAAMGYSPSSMSLAMTAPHSCQDGGYGLSDFLGWEAIQEPDGIFLDKEESGLTEEG